MKLFRDPRIQLLVVVAIVMLAGFPAKAAPGDLDTTFDPGPILWQGASFPAFKYAVAIQPDGKILIGGRFDTVQGVPRVFIARLNLNGSLDTSFVPVLQTFTIGSQPDGEVYDIILQPDSRILVSGYFGVAGQFKTVVRLNSDGTLDPTFSVTTDGGSPVDNLIYRMLLQPDGKIVIGSNSLDSVNGVATDRLARLTSTGALDTALGVTGNISYGVFALALQGDGKIIVAGSGGAVSRLNGDGTPDPGWTFPNIGFTAVDSLAIEPDGQVLVGARGRLTVNGSLTDGLIRLNPNGTFDLSFNPPDVRTAFSLLVQNDGKILVGGHFTVNFGLFLSGFGRLNPDGSLDFMSNNGPDNDVFDIARQADGKFIAAGAFENFNPGPSAIVRTGVARILESGAAPPLTGKIVFDSKPTPTFLEIASMNPDGTNRTPLTTTGFDYNPSVASDGSKIAFLSLRDKTFEEIYVMNSDGSGQTRLTTDDNADTGPAISPDGTKIAFASNRNGNWDIYIINSTGAPNEQRLTTNALRDEEPAFSPDGTKIVFRSNRDGNAEIYVMDVNGANQTRLTTTAGDVTDVQPAFSPDGTKIVFQTSRDGNLEIYSMNANGSSPTRLTNNTAIDADPTYSPDGSRIAFSSFRDGNYEIYSIESTGLNPMRLTTNAFEDGRPSWGGLASSPPPSAGKIAFYSRRDGIPEIYTMNPDGSGTSRLTNNSVVDYDPSLSRNGSKIAYVVSDVNTNNGFDEIYVMNSDGSGSTRLTNNLEFDLEPSINADASKIVFSSRRDGNYEIYIMDVNGLNQTRLTNNTGFDQQPSFSADRTKITFSSNRDGNFEIYSMDLNGANQTRLTTNSAGDTEPVFSPDGTKIAFRSDRSGNSEIWVMDANGANPVNLTNNPAADLFATYSPDGGRIAFTTLRDGELEIYYMNSDGSSPVRITTNTVEDSRPSWGNAGSTPPPPTPPAKMKVSGGNVLVGSPGAGIILRSPNGTMCVKIGIDNSGNMTTVITPCP